MTTTTPRRPAPCPPALSRGGPPQPAEPAGAVAAIGRRIGALEEEHNHLDKAALQAPADSPERHAARERMDAINGDLWRLRDEVAALRAETLADVAAQALVCLTWADRLYGRGISEARLLRRMAASMAMATATIGRFDLARVGDADDARLCARVLAKPRPSARNNEQVEGREGEPPAHDAAVEVGAKEANHRFVQRVLLALLDSGMLGEEAEELVERAAACEGLVP